MEVRDSRYKSLIAMPRLCARFQPHVVDIWAFGRAFMNFACFGHILASFEMIELTPTDPPCRKNLHALCMCHDG